MAKGELMKIVFVPILIGITSLCGFACLFACLEGDTGFGFYFFLAACLSGFSLWTNVRDDPVLKENMVVGEVHPAAWQLEEVMDIRLEAYLNRTWKRLHKEWGFDPADVSTYDDGLVTGFALATRQIACHFDIKLEKL
jgi:hypothetical protein